MSSNSSVQGSVTLRKLRTGATATISLSSSMQLFQLWSQDTLGNYVYAPDWSGSNTHPTVTVNAVSSAGTVTVTGVVWKINNQLASGIAGITARATGGVYSLEINTNLAQASILNFNSGTLTAEITFTDDSGHSQMVTKSEIIRVQQAVSNGYVVMINADRTWVDESNNATLSAVIYQGVTPVTSGITFAWFNSTSSSASSIGTGASLTVTPAMVNGSQLFICRAYDGANNEVDAEAVTIVDNSDTYVITAKAQQYKGGSSVGITEQQNVTSVNVGSDNEKTTVTFAVATSDGTVYAGTPSAWTAQKLHADTLALIGEVSGMAYTTDTTTVDAYNTATASSSANISIDVLDADYVSAGASGTATHDTEVVVTATATL